MAVIYVDFGCKQQTFSIHLQQNGSFCSLILQFLTSVGIRFIYLAIYFLIILLSLNMLFAYDADI